MGKTPGITSLVKYLTGEVQLGTRREPPHWSGFVKFPEENRIDRYISDTFFINSFPISVGKWHHLA